MTKFIACCIRLPLSSTNFSFTAYKHDINKQRCDAIGNSRQKRDFQTVGHNYTASVPTEGSFLYVARNYKSSPPPAIQPPFNGHGTL
jgi:hypothetical protein